MMRTLIAIFLSLLGLGLLGCKTREVTKPDPDTERLLAECKRDKEELAKLTTELQATNTQLQMKKNTIIVKIEGGAMTVGPDTPGGVMPIDKAVAEAGAREFIGIIEKSKGSIQKCYEQALKKSSGLASREVMLTVYATFNPQGAVSSADSDPKLGEPFDGCIKQVAHKWTVKGVPSTMTYQQVVKLKPS
jgi:hypothetical protein